MSHYLKIHKWRKIFWIKFNWPTVLKFYSNFLWYCLLWNAVSRIEWNIEQSAIHAYIYIIPLVFITRRVTIKQPALTIDFIIERLSKGQTEFIQKILTPFTWYTYLYLAFRNIFLLEYKRKLQYFRHVLFACKYQLNTEYTGNV